MNQAHAEHKSKQESSWYVATDTPPASALGMGVEMWWRWDGAGDR